MTDDLDQTTITPPGTYEPAPDAAPNVLPSQVLQPVTPQDNRKRWAIAVGVVGAVVLASAFAFSLFTGRAANAVVLGYVPEDSIMYGEVRMDLPGDQHANVGAFLSKFPGFADQSTIESKIDEVLDRIVREASSGEQAFSSDIKPWFGGQMAFSVGALPDPGSLSSPEPPVDDARFLFLVSVKDAAAAEAWFNAVIAEGDTQTEVTKESYNGATLHVFNGPNPPTGAFAILNGKVGVIGDPSSVKAAVDTGGNGAFANQPEPKAALEATTGDHIGFVWIALRPLLEWSSQLAESGVPGELPSDALLGMIPDWSAFALRVEGDALLMESISPPAAGATAATNRTSAVADHVPGNAVALSISHDYGGGLLDTLETYRSDPALAEVIEAIDQAMGFLGGPDEAVGWIGDFGITVTQGDDAAEGGLIIAPTDSDSAQQLFSSLRTLASLGGTQMGIEVRDEDHAGTTITVIDLGELSDLAGQAGLPPDVTIGAAPLSGRVELAYAVTDKVVILGSGPGFVRSVLDTTPENSLASTERYRSAFDRAGQGSGVAFADITAIRELVESALAENSPDDVAAYEQEIKPFLEPFDVLVATSKVDGALTRATTIVTVK